MTDRLTDIRNDLAFMRALAQEGRNTPLLTGSILIWAGCVWGLAALAHWAVASRLLDLPPVSLAVIWGTAAVVFFVALFAILRHRQGTPGEHSPLNRAVGEAWSAVGFNIFVLVLALIAFSVTQRVPAAISLIGPVVLAAYGTAWAVAAGLARVGWMRLVSLTAYAGAVLMAAISTRPEAMLLYAALLVLTALVPGVVLRRAEPSRLV